MLENISDRLGTKNLRFPGQYYDEETGLYYNYYRYYDPQIGRYITSDPIGLRGGLNTYNYSSQNPIKKIDFYGLDTKRCYRHLGNPQKGDTGIYNPVRHDYLVVGENPGSKLAKATQLGIPILNEGSLMEMGGRE